MHIVDNSLVALTSKVETTTVMSYDALLLRTSTGCANLLFSYAVNVV